MRWQGGRRSSNIEDRRGARRPGRAVGGGLGTIVLILVALYFGVDPSFLIDGMQTGSAPSASTSGPPLTDDLQNDPLAEMISVVVADTEDVWGEIFASQGQRYQQPTRILFSGATRSACV